MPFRFENLDVWRQAVEYVDLIYAIAEQLPRSEEFNLKSQIVRAATSVALNIAEGSTGQTKVEHARFLGIAIRSLIETVACLQLIRRRRYPVEDCSLDTAYTHAERLAKQLHAF